MNPKIVKCHIHQDINQEISNEMFQESNGTAQNTLKKPKPSMWTKGILTECVHGTEKEDTQNGGKRSHKAGIHKQ